MILEDSLLEGTGWSRIKGRNTEKESNICLRDISTMGNSGTIRSGVLDRCDMQMVTVMKVSFTMDLSMAKEDFYKEMESFMTVSGKTKKWTASVYCNSPMETVFKDFCKVELSKATVC